MCNNFSFTLKFPLWLRLLEVCHDHSWLHCLYVAPEPQDGLTIWCMNLFILHTYLFIVISVSSSHIHARSAFIQKSAPMQCLTNTLYIQSLKMLNFHGRTLKAAFLLFIFFLLQSIPFQMLSCFSTILGWQKTAGSVCHGNQWCHTPLVTSCGTAWLKKEVGVAWTILISDAMRGLSTPRMPQSSKPRSRWCNSGNNQQLYLNLLASSPFKATSYDV